jgi:hypothetical protein
MPPKKRATSKKKDETVVDTSEEHSFQVANIAKEDDNGQTDDEHILLKLPISDAQLDILLQDQEMNSVLQYIPTIREPEPYMPTDHFSNDADVLCSMPVVTQPQSSVSSSVTAVSSQASMKKKGTCFWCCHEVDHMSYGMPIRYDFVNKSFTMYGTFCSLECAAAHNFSVHLGSDRAWEIHSWIQMLGKRYGFVEPIRPAPSRYLLDMFDGPLSIEEFRNAHKGQTRTYVLNIPPMITVNSQMEVVNTSFLGNTDSAKLTEKHPRKSGAEKRKTLDTKMNLTIE